MARHGAKRPKKMDVDVYNAEVRRLQADLVTFQEWVRATGQRVVVVFEGRDAAGKGSAIKRITEYLSPRVARIAALPAPSGREKTEWYFQRYVAHLPAAGEMVLFDRSWYNRAGVERVMGFCTDEQYSRFLEQAPVFEKMLVDDGVIVRKYWFSVSDIEQERRFRSRAKDPMRQWKLSPMDLESITRWEDYSEAKDIMMDATSTAWAPWHVVESEDKRRSRVNVMHHLLTSIPHEPMEAQVPPIPARPARRGYERPPQGDQNYVHDHASDVLRLAKGDRS
jgi:polyphosphate kinase 2